MATPEVVDHEQWLQRRLELLEKEKAFTRARDALSAHRRSLPWERVTKIYQFEGTDGTVQLSSLFEGRTQLIVYHFMLGPDWTEGCKSCSFWADNFANIGVHLAHRDVTLVAVSRAPRALIERYRLRMGWSFPWYSSFASDFNYDYDVSMHSEQTASGKATYNYETYRGSMTELPGVSVFATDANGCIYHTYSTYARGLDMLNGAYHLLDLVPKGRDEATLSYPMEWVRRHDQYG